MTFILLFSLCLGAECRYHWMEFPETRVESGLASCKAMETRVRAEASREGFRVYAECIKKEPT